MPGLSLDSFVPTSPQYHRTTCQSLIFIVIGIVLTVFSSIAYGYLPPPSGGSGGGGYTTFMAPVRMSSQPAPTPTTFLVRGDGTVPIYRIRLAPRISRRDALSASSTLNTIPQIKVELDRTVKPNIESVANNKWYVKIGPWPNRNAAAMVLDLIENNSGETNALIVTTDIPLTTAQAWQLPLKKTLYHQALDSSSSPGGNPYSLFSTVRNQWIAANSAKDWISTVPKFAQLLKGNIITERRREALFMTGEGYRKAFLDTPKEDKSKRSEFAQAAIAAFSDYVRQYPDGPHAAYAQKKIGSCEHAVSNYHSARLQKAANAYPW